MMLVLKVQQQVQAFVQPFKFLWIDFNLAFFQAQVSGNVFQLQQTAVQALAKLINLSVVLTDTMAVVADGLQVVNDVVFFLGFKDLNTLV